MRTIQRRSGRGTAMILFSIIAIISFVYLVQRLELDNAWFSLLQQVGAYGWRGELAFMAIVSICVIGMLPSAPLTVGAGILFGLVKGSLIIVLAETIGACIAFLLGRKLLAARSTKWLNKHRRLSAVLELPGRQSWRLVALTRMLPFFPFKLSNYLFGLTPLSVYSYVKGTFLGLWPITLFNVYLGSVTTDLIALQSTDSADSHIQWLLYCLGFAFTGIIMIIAIHRATREINRRTASK